MGTAPGITWVFKDAWFNILASSQELCLEEAQDKMMELTDTQHQDRPICLKVFVEGRQIREENCENALEAYDFLFEYQQEDQQSSPQPRTLVSFVAANRRNRDGGRSRATTKFQSFNSPAMAIIEDDDEDEG